MAVDAFNITITGWKTFDDVEVDPGQIYYDLSFYTAMAKFKSEE